MRVSTPLFGSLSMLLLQVKAQDSSDEGGQTITGGISGNGGTVIIDGTTVSNCPGEVLSTSTGSLNGVFCCIEEDPSTVSASMCAGYPFCSDSTAVAMSINTPSCVTMIPATASNYDQLVASATSSVGNGGSNGGSSTAAASPGSTTSSGPQETSAQSSGSQSASATATSSTSGNEAAGMAKVPLGWMCVGTGLGALAGVLAAVI
ncbi:uncharacterized protein PV06_06799 [Exophiala oligosperma]|uniref:Extracellular membrane protein CFEM domain-containing protein n=1 Tax=Exophiala oligosperma TaxID=215243 RepID=A0A0D2E0A4_9EURO|nr:uncharacterized protein PV06_06799 [Exophiala oligosperma]KIW41224.1 hypothetical protein PV06_06799 [Exophiala oligosperma]